jgi:hypothetical protein
MEEFDASLRRAIEAGGDNAVQFIRRSADGRIVPCNPNKILVAATQTLRPHKRILPIGFQSHYATGRNGIQQAVEKIDERIEELCGFNQPAPVLVALQEVIAILKMIEPTLHFPDDDAPDFDWGMARSALTHLSVQLVQPSSRGEVWVWAATGRRASRRPASENSHVAYIETPDSKKTEGQMAVKYAIDHPIVFFLRQDGLAAQGWRDTPFYWPVIRAQANAPTAIFTAETIP